MYDKMQSFLVLEKLPLGFEVLTSHTVASATLVDGSVAAEYQHEEMSVTEPCFRSVDTKLVGSGLSWFRIDDVLPFSVNTK